MDEQTKQKRKDIVGWVIYIAVLLAIIITFRCFLMIGRVPSESMEPTLMVHDNIAALWFFFLICMTVSDEPVMNG